ncbi:MAG: cell wall-binding repeat-containing protein, partial [Firmicutes bacterium]|nr:cell wall-binding repeat-containing protein [Bacillota bacterium]
MELRFYIYYNGGAAVLYSPQFNITWTSYRGSVRIYGDNRYETAGLIADRKLFAEGKDKYDHVIIASGLDFADALGGSYLAKAADAPMLLVNKDPAVMKDTAQDIAARLKDDGFVFILGGTGAVSEDMETELKAAGLTHIKR